MSILDIFLSFILVLETKHAPVPSNLSCSEGSLIRKEFERHIHNNLERQIYNLKGGTPLVKLNSTFSLHLLTVLSVHRTICCSKM